MLEIITFITEIIGTVAFAASGAIVGIEKKMDILGITILGITTACGGGIIRDLLLGSTPPQAFKSPVYAIVATAVSLIVFIPAVRKLFIGRRQPFFDTLLLVMDSLGLAIFTVVGIKFATAVSDNVFLIAFVGVVTGVGGGVMRDTMSQNIPFIFRKHFYCTSAIIGAVITVALWHVIGSQLSMLAGAVTIFVLRMLAAKFRWKLPKAE